MATTNELKKEVFDYIRLMLGDQMVDVELDPEHYEMALKQTLMRYRQRSANAHEESYSFIELVADQNTYILPQEVMMVRQLFRASVGSSLSTTSTNFEPFEAGYLNMYMLQANRTGGLLTYELFSQYQELNALMFGGYLNYNFNKVTKALTIIKRPRASGENVLVWTYNYKPDVTLLSDYMAAPWIRDYSLAIAKKMLGEAREMAGSIPGPGGGTTLNGSTLKQEAQSEMERLDTELTMLIDGGSPYGVIMG